MYPGGFDAPRENGYNSRVPGIDRGDLGMQGFGQRRRLPRLGHLVAAAEDEGHRAVDARRGIEAPCVAVADLEVGQEQVVVAPAGLYAAHQGAVGTVQPAAGARVAWLGGKRRMRIRVDEVDGAQRCVARGL